MPRLRDWTGVRVGTLTVLSRCEANMLNGDARWNCICECGNATTVSCSSLHKQKSCGCLKSAGIKAAQTVHGHASKTADTIHEYNSWLAMIRRCTDPSHGSFKNYGGRGISIAPEWLDLDAFIRDMGRRPTALHTLDRIDNNGHYSASNCRWADRKTQARNRRNNRNITFRGKTQAVAAWCEELGINKWTVKHRLRHGVSVNDGLFSPKRINNYGVAILAAWKSK